LKISIIGTLFDASGYAQALRSIAFGLLDKVYNVRIIPRDWSQLECGLPDSQKQLLSICWKQCSAGR